MRPTGPTKAERAEVEAKMTAAGRNSESKAGSKKHSKAPQSAGLTPPGTR